MASKRPADFGKSGPSEKKKRLSLTIAQKVELLKKLDSGLPVRKLCEMYGCGSSTVYDLKKQKVQLLTYFADSDSKKLMSKRKHLKPGMYEDLEVCLMEWFRQVRSEGVKLSGDMILEQARIFFDLLNIEGEFHLSSGWLDRFKKRHGISEGTTCVEAKSADHENAERYVDVFEKIIKDENLSPEQVYNADETALYWRCMPHKILRHEDEGALEGFKEPKDRVTVLACANAAGSHRCKPLVIGKSQNPRALKGMRVLPVHYRANKRAWMTQKMMLEWFEKMFVPEAREHCRKAGLPKDCKILLLLDNCPGHPPADQMMKDNVFVTYMPPNCTSLIQPQEKGILRSMKRKYRRNFMRKMLMGASEGKTIDEFRKEYNMRNVLYGVANAWDMVEKSTLHNCWHKLWPSLLFQAEELDDIDADFGGFRVSEAKKTVGEIMEYAKQYSSSLSKELQDKAVEEWLDVDDDGPVAHAYTSQEIVRMVTTPEEFKKEQREEDSDDENSTQDDEHPKKLSHDRTIELCEELICALEQRPCITEQQIMQVYNIQSTLIKEKPKLLMQTKLQDLFKAVCDKSTPSPHPSSAPDIVNIPVSPSLSTVTPVSTPPETPDISNHSDPADISDRQQDITLAAVPSTCKELNNTYKVCSRHFEPDMYMIPISPRLKHSAVPTIPVQENISQGGTLSVESAVAVPSPKTDIPDASSKISIATECVEESDGRLHIFIPSTDSEKGSSRDSMTAESLDDWGYFDGGGGNDPLEVTSISSDMTNEEANSSENTSRVFCSADFSTPEGIIIKPNTPQHQESDVPDKLNGEIATEFIEVKDEHLDDWREVGDCNTLEESGDPRNDMLCSQERDAHDESVKAEPLDNWKDIDEYNNRLLQVKEELDREDDDQFYSTIFEVTGSRANALSVVSERGQIIGLWEAGKSKVEISRQLGVHRTTVHKWIKRWRQEGSLKTKHRCGRPQVTSQTQNRAIVERALARPLTPAVELTKELELPCSVWTVRRRLHAAGKMGADREGGAVS